jgi:hypothetical protein
MKLSVFLTAALLLGFSAMAFAQADTSFQVRYATNLTFSDSLVDVTNTGAASTTAGPPQDGNICVNVYGLTGATLIHCCSCLVKPDALASLSVQKDLLANNNFPPDSMVIKLISTSNGATTTSSNCNAHLVGTDAAHTTTTGMAAWGTVSQPLSPNTQASNATETPFTPSTLSDSERLSLNAKCTVPLGAGSICNSCK